MLRFSWHLSNNPLMIVDDYGDYVALPWRSDAFYYQGQDDFGEKYKIDRYEGRFGG